MDIPKFKDITKKLSFLKDYSSLSVPSAIGLVAVFLFILTSFMGRKLAKQITDESISKGGQQIKFLSRNVPSRDQWKVEEEYQRAHEKDANAVALLALQGSKRQLLSYKIFPEPKDTSAFLFTKFGQEFRIAVDGLITRVNGRDCPTDAELEAAISAAGVAASGAKKLSGTLGGIDAAIIDSLCQKNAESASVYANPADVSGYEFWENYQYVGVDKAVEDCWYWQLGYWIIEDVFDTIGALNSGSMSVLNSPAKRLMDVSFVKSASHVRERAAEDKPHYVLSVADGFCEPWTGRFSNDYIDVVHFNIAVLVSTKAVLPFMRQLCIAKEQKFRGFFDNEPEQNYKHSQITILESKMEPIEQKDEKTHGYYRYGEDAVVKLDLICEYIFNKSAYDEIKPVLLKKQPVSPIVQP